MQVMVINKSLCRGIQEKKLCLIKEENVVYQNNVGAGSLQRICVDHTLVM